MSEKNKPLLSLPPELLPEVGLGVDFVVLVVSGLGSGSASLVGSGFLEEVEVCSGSFVEVGSGSFVGSGFFVEDEEVIVWEVVGT